MSGLANVRGLLIDLDGTLYQEGRQLPGAARAIEELRRHGLKLRFMTNTSARMPENIAAGAQALGLDIAAEDIFSPVQAALEWLSPRPRQTCLFLLDPAVRGAFSAYTAASDDADTVVMGDMGSLLSMELLNQAFRCLRNGASFVALQRNPFWFGPHGPTLDAGAFIAALEVASARQALVVGKPNVAFFELAAASLGLSNEELLVVGDDVTTDVAGASAARMASVLLRSGKFTEQQLAGATSQPTSVLDAFADVPRWLASAGCSLLGPLGSSHLATERQP